MNAAHDYDDMHQFVDRLTPVQVRRLRLLVSQDDELAHVAAAVPSSGHDVGPSAGLQALIGTVDGPPDLAESHDNHVAERMRERFGHRG